MFKHVTDTVPKEVVIIDGQQLNEKQLKRYHKQLRKDSIRAQKKIWWSVLGGPSYTPEASLGVGGAVLASFRLNKNDTISQRSFLPAGINLSLNGTIVVAGAAFMPVTDTGTNLPTITVMGMRRSSMSTEATPRPVITEVTSSCILALSGKFVLTSIWEDYSISTTPKLRILTQ